MPELLRVTALGRRMLHVSLCVGFNLLIWVTKHVCLQALRTLAKKYPDVIVIVHLGMNFPLFWFFQASHSAPTCRHAHWLAFCFSDSTIDHRWCSVLFFPLSDTSDLCSIKKSAQQVASVVGAGGLNLLINNAGVLYRDNLQTTTPENMQSTFSTNVLGPTNIIKVSKEVNPLHWMFTIREDVRTLKGYFLSPSSWSSTGVPASASRSGFVQWETRDVLQ